MKLGAVFGAILMRDFAMARRYYFNSISGLVSIYIAFVLALFGIRAFAGAASPIAGDGTLESTIVGFFVWTLTIYSYSDFSWGLINEAQAGTLEQLYLSPAGFRWIAAFSIMSSLLFSLIPVFVALFAMMATARVWLVFDLASLVPLMLISSLGAIGVGYALGGLALVFKRVQAVFQIVQFLFIGIMIVPHRLWWARLLPTKAAFELIRTSMVDGLRLWQLPAAEIAVAVLVGVGYLAAGMGIFAACERVAKRRGLLGHY